MEAETSQGKGEFLALTFYSGSNFRSMQNAWQLFSWGT